MVLVGREPGIYESWSQTEKQVKWFAGAKFKSYENFSLAKKAFDEKNLDQNTFQDWKKFVPVWSICCDWASSWNPWNMEFQIVDPYCKKNIFSSKIFACSTNNIGEFLAIVKAFELTEKVLIFSDSKIAISWIKQKKCKTKLLKNNLNQESFSIAIDTDPFWSLLPIHLLLIQLQIGN